MKNLEIIYPILFGIINLINLTILLTYQKMKK